MQQKLEIYNTYTIASHWLSALINGDYTGLSDEEEIQLDSWLDKKPVGIWSDISEEPTFARDAISGLMAGCYEVTLYTHDQEQPQ